MEMGERILEAREKRYELIRSLQKQYDAPVLCAKVNYPGTDKNTERARLAFYKLKKAMEEAFSEDQIFSCMTEGADGSALLMILPMTPQDAKGRAMEIEERHILGRIFDIDVYGEDGEPLDREALGVRPRSCILCEGDARQCMKEGKHSLKEVLEGFDRLIDEQSDPKEWADRIAEAMLYGMLSEISTHPSPGLVSPFSNGAHSDMDYFTFLKSTSAISSVMRDCAMIGIKEKADLLHKLRKIGLKAEKRMFDATEGVNTQKGILFLGGIACCAAGSCLRQGLPVDRENISIQCRNICEGIIENELHAVKKLHESIQDKESHAPQGPRAGKKAVHLSNGEKLFLRHGALGVRGEAAAGLPTVMDCGLPIYESTMDEGLDEKVAMVNCLIGIMSVLEDTTVLNRCGTEGVELMQSMSCLLYTSDAADE